jgi:hypothetical protein
LHRGAYPVLADVPAATFLRVLSASEIGIGAALRTPFIGKGWPGAALTAFSGGLLGMYHRTPALHEEGSVWPTRAGTAISKDVWMLGIGVGLMADRA